MASRITNCDIRTSAYQNKYYVTTDVLNREEILYIVGVSCVLSNMEKDTWLVEISRLYDHKSVLDDIRALADKHADTTEEAAASEKPAEPDEPECAEPQSDHPLSTRSLTAVLKEMQKSLEREILDEYLNDKLQHSMEFHLLIHQQCPWTHAIITYRNIHIGHGYSKCNWPDVWDEEFGALLGVKRAARRLARLIYPG